MKSLLLCANTVGGFEPVGVPFGAAARVRDRTVLVVYMDFSTS
jgi:hypothetical protein